MVISGVGRSIGTPASRSDTLAGLGSLGSVDVIPPNEQNSVELTILMPCLDEAETIEACVTKASEFLRSRGVAGEVLIADNGSTDGSQEIASRAGARVVQVPSRGYGAALNGGIEAARGRYVIMGDADDSYDFLSLDLFLGRLRAGDDLVMGNRFTGGIKPGAMPLLHKYLGNPVLSLLGRIFFRVPIRDFHCGLRGFSRVSILDMKLVSEGMEFASEMIVKASLKGLKFSEVPTTLSPHGRSRAPHLKTWSDGWRHLRFLLLHSPKWLFFYPGVAMLGLGLVGILALLPGPLRLTPTTVLDIHTLLAASFAVLIGIQLISFSVLARRYAASEGFLTPVWRYPSIIGNLTLERELHIALIILILGVSGFVWATWYWASQNFGPIAYAGVLRVLIVSLMLIAVSIQLAASAFLASVLTIRRKIK
jgi:glycosyltransferase involved in cell wall biosynthesis